jgi:hypothetical protein
MTPFSVALRSMLAETGAELQEARTFQTGNLQVPGLCAQERFTSLLHHVDPAMLRTAFYAMKRDAAPGVDGMTWETYEQDLDRRIETLHARVQAGAQECNGRA